MLKPTLETVEHETGPDPKMSFIWLHGLGADGHDFEPIVAELRLPFAARFVFPHAPIRPITINGGIPMRAWFDILSVSRDAAEDEAAIRESAAAVTELIDREVQRGQPNARIVLAGFSQGGALALHVGLRDSRPLGGILALSAFLTLRSSLAIERSSENAAIPIFMAHGTEDPIIELGFAEKSRDALQAAGYMPHWLTYPMGHAVCAQEIRDVAEWLNLVERRID